MRLVPPPPEGPEESPLPEPPPDNLRHGNFGQQSEVTLRSYDSCRHRNYKLHTEARAVKCGVCGAELDAFQVLLDYAHSERQWRHWDTERLKQMVKLAELKTEERKVKARTKSASRKDAAAAVAEERVRSERERIEISQATRDIVELCRRIERRVQRRRTL